MKALFLPLILSLYACSGTNERRLVSDNGSQETVPKKKYEELLGKYKALQEKIRFHEGSNPPSLTETPEEIETAPDLVETVDVFAIKNTKKNRGPTSVADALKPDASSGIEEAVEQVKQGIDLVGQKKYSEAIEKLRPLESSGVGQVRVRAKFYMGESYFMQGEYDLAMQIFEDIIAKESFSGLVLKVLDRLITCSEKLNNKKKQETYHSMLHDFFEN